MLASVLNRNEWEIVPDITATLSVLYVPSCEDSPCHHVGLKLYTGLCYETIPWACLGVCNMFTSTLDYADSTYPYMKGMLIVALEGKVENIEVQPKLEYGNWSIWKPKYGN